MRVRTDEVVNKEAAVEQGLQLCRFAEDVYPTWDTLSPWRRILILGAGKFAEELCRVILSQRFGMVEIVGVLVGENERAERNPDLPGLIGTYEQVVRVVEEHKVTTILVCLEDRRSVLPVEQLLDLKAMGIDVRDGHQVFEEVSGRLSIDSLRPSALVFANGFRQRMSSRIMKRFGDMLIAISGLLMLIPLFLLVALLIKVDSPGPVFYRQTRVGLRGRPFAIWKFRSMHQDAENAGPQWAQASDPRISRVGWWLRKTRVDEFPQLVNVLRGEMSLVGPRPERPVFVQDLRKTIPYYDLRHTVRPGITGWAQVKFRYSASADDAHMKLQYDLYYVKRLSFALDMQIFAETIRVMCLGEGAQ
jgi:sugar transferase (PEP-CTERM system associated)